MDSLYINRIQYFIIIENVYINTYKFIHSHAHIITNIHIYRNSYRLYTSLIPERTCTNHKTKLTSYNIITYSVCFDLKEATENSCFHSIDSHYITLMSLCLFIFNVAQIYIWNCVLMIIISLIQMMIGKDRSSLTNDQVLEDPIIY